MNDFAAKHLVDRMCEAGHVAYEAKAQEVGWSTQPMSRVPWALVPHENQLAMKASMAAARDVVRAAVNDIPYEGADDRFDPVLELLGGGSDA